MRFYPAAFDRWLRDIGEQNFNSLVKKQWILMNMSLDEDVEYDIQAALNEQLVWAINQEAYQYLRARKEVEELREQGIEPGQPPLKSGPAVDTHVKELEAEAKKNAPTQVGVG